MRYEVHRVHAGENKLVPDASGVIGTAGSLEKARDLADQDPTGLQKRIYDTMNLEWFYADEKDEREPESEHEQFNWI